MSNRLFRAIMNDEDTSINESMFDTDPYLFRDTEDKIKLLNDAYFLQEYFSNHELDENTFEIICRFNDAIDRLGITLPAIETLNINIYATDEFLDELNNKIAAQEGAIGDFFEKIGNLLKRIWDYFFGEYEPRKSDTQDNNKQIADNEKDKSKEFDTEKAKDIKLKIYEPKLVIKFIQNCNRLFEQNKKTRKIEYDKIMDLEVSSGKVKLNAAGFEYRLLSRTLKKLIEDENKEIKEFTLLKIYDDFYKGKSKSEIDDAINRLDIIYKALEAKKNDLEKSINQQKRFDTKYKKSGHKAYKITQDEYVEISEVSKFILKVITMYKNVSEKVKNNYKDKKTDKDNSNTTT